MSEEQLEVVHVKSVCAYLDTVRVGNEIMSWEDLMNKYRHVKAESLTVDCFYIGDNEQLAKLVDQLNMLRHRLSFEEKPPEMYLERKSDKERRLASKPSRKKPAPAPMPLPVQKYVVPEGNWVCPGCGCDYPEADVLSEWKESGTCKECR